MIATATLGYSPRRNTSDDRPCAPGILKSSRTNLTSLLRASAFSSSPWLATSISSASGMSRLSVSTSAALNIGWSSATMMAGEFTESPKVRLGVAGNCRSPSYLDSAALRRASGRHDDWCQALLGLYRHIVFGRERRRRNGEENQRAVRIRLDRMPLPCGNEYHRARPNRRYFFTQMDLASSIGNQKDFLWLVIEARGRCAAGRQGKPRNAEPGGLGIACDSSNQLLQPKSRRHGDCRHAIGGKRDGLRRCHCGFLGAMHATGREFGAGQPTDVVGKRRIFALQFV